MARLNIEVDIAIDYFYKKFINEIESNRYTNYELCPSYPYLKYLLGGELDGGNGRVHS